VLHDDHLSIINQREIGIDTQNCGQALRARSARIRTDLIVRAGGARAAARSAADLCVDADLALVDDRQVVVVEHLDRVSIVTM